MITWQTKIIVSPLPHSPWPLSLGGWWLTLGDYWQSQVMLWSCGFVRSCDKLLYLYYYSPNGYQTWQDGDLLWGAPTHKVLRSDHVRPCDNLKSLYLHYHSAYGLQTWQLGDFLWWVSTHVVISPFYSVVMWNHVAN